MVGIGFFSLCFLMTSLGGQFSAKRPGDPPFTARAEGKLLRLCPAPIMTRLPPPCWEPSGAPLIATSGLTDLHTLLIRGPSGGSSARYTSISLSPSFPALATSTSRALFDLHLSFPPGCACGALFFLAFFCLKDSAAKILPSPHILRESFLPL